MFPGAIEATDSGKTGWEKIKRAPSNEECPSIVTAAFVTNGQKSSGGPQQWRQRGSLREVVEGEFLEVAGGYQLLLL